MDINYNIISLIDTVALIQSLVFGIFLIFKHKQNRPSLFLGLFLLTYSTDLVTSILFDTGIIYQNTSLLFLPINFYFLTIPFLYLYTRALLKPIRSKPTMLLLFSLGGLELAFFMWLFFLPSGQKEKLVQSSSFQDYYEYYQLTSIAFSIGLLVLIIRLISQYKRRMLDFYSNIVPKRLRWLQIVAYIIIAYDLISVVSIVQWELPFGKTLYNLLTFGNLFFVYWITISGIRQKRIQLPDEMTSPDNSTPAPQPQNNDSEKYDEIYNHISQNKLFKQAELNLPDLAQELNLPRRELSRLINQHYGDNYNKFINQFRIEEAKIYLTNPDFNYLNMSGIADEVGFSSKATFFTAFKNSTGMSPGQFKKKAQKPDF